MVGEFRVPLGTTGMELEDRSIDFFAILGLV